MERQESNSNLIYSKIILFGEYSMILDSKALMFPFRKFFAQWQNGQDKVAESSRKSILSLVEYLEKDAELRELIDTKSIKNDLNQGLYLFSNIPSGYGLGSSGALVAALWQRYATKTIGDFLELKRVFGRMESFFHGSSSGIDPLQCYIGKPFVINREGVSILPDDFVDSGIEIGLIDTKTKSGTGPLVRHFREMLNDTAYKDRFENEYLPCLNCCMETISQGGKAFFDNLSQFTALQNELFEPMITPDTRHLFATQYDFNFGVKILGSGGGGYVLCFTDDKKTALNLLSGFDVIWL